MLQNLTCCHVNALLALSLSSRKGMGREEEGRDGREREKEGEGKERRKEAMLLFFFYCCSALEKMRRACQHGEAGS